MASRPKLAVTCSVHTDDTTRTVRFKPTLLLPSMSNPRPSTYGEHAELTAAALTRLTSPTPLPTDPQDVEQMLRCRDAVLDSVRQRLYDFGVITNVDASPSRLAPWTPFKEERIPIQLAVIASCLPRMQEGDRPPPSEALSRRSMDPTVDLWRTAAIESLAASAALSSTLQSWTVDDPSGRWLVLRDAAGLLESIALLDLELREVGLLNQHDAPHPMPPIEDVRAVLAQAGRVAGWRMTSDDVDRLASPVRYPVAGERGTDGVVQLVRSVADLSAAQGKLASALRVPHGTNAFASSEPHISARVARFVVTGQLFVHSLHSQLAEPSVDVTDRSRRRERLDALVEVDRRVAHLIDADPRQRMAGAASYLQQTEITTSLHRLQREGRLEPLTDDELRQLDVATASVCRHFGMRLRRELLRDDSNLRLADPSGEVGPARGHRRSPLDRAIGDLIKASMPKLPPAAHSVSVQRAVLQHALDSTPTRPTRPTPRPRAAAPLHRR